MNQKNQFDFDVLIIGSGFGGSVSALRLAEKGFKVAVLERGRRFSSEDFPKSNWSVTKYLWAPLLKCFGIQNISLYRHCMILGGSGVGGGSLVYANTLLQPEDKIFDAPQWKHVARWKEELKPHYDTARRMLGVNLNPKMTFVDEAFRSVAQELSRGESFRSVPVGIYFAKPGEEGKTVPDPYFGGAGPERKGCIYCGGCMVGCRHDAKNTLDKNYLYLAEKRGVQIIPEITVDRIEPLDSRDPSQGYQVGYYSSQEAIFRSKKHLRARFVVVSAGVLGSVRLLLRCRDQLKTLPRISSQLGAEVRTNSEALLGVTAPASKPENFSEGIAISSMIQADDVTFVEPCRYPEGSSFMRVLAVPLVEGNSPWFLIRMLHILLTILSHPLDMLRLAFHRNWAGKSIIVLVMQTLESKMKLKTGRHVLTFFQKSMVSESDGPMPVKIDIADRVTKMLAQKLGGIPQSSINEISLRIPTTAHILGGCILGEDSASAVVNAHHEVFNYPGLFVMDGSTIPANLGVNPSLTITAMAERFADQFPYDSNYGKMSSTV